ncbi:uncharacterized protein SEPMUDRAFT_146608 [Sphaerulina musiva SO2202]|uniref:Yeast cell wall synthesis Kre9/Knh1-like N-terminal domain-containing protein n=1 Tax=Sphaerulina musiva (strain SO2202) TaxID=692275 RepID=N1QMP3_SPHMS|nr:uncharacterized protein SEPMUDRAFT_146608 [Sphaerulina musiva SO2202]EMF17642.1 hypothetical protein SEPMUDRAFT_146608 [Sphaerulina musiva SO2202]
MQFPRSLLLTLVSALAAYAQTATGPNAFTNVGLAAKAGEPLTLTWNPTTGGTVSLVLRNGASNNLNAGTTIASNIENSGSYTWTPDSDAVRGSDYTIQIINDQNDEEVNYSPYFVLDSDNTVASTTAASSTTSVAPLPSTISTASPTSSGMTTSMSMSSSSMSGSSSSMTSTRTASSSSPSQTSSDGSQTSSGAGARATAMVGMLGAIALGAMAL